MRRARLLLAGLALALAPALAAAQAIVTSPRPDRVAVTIYRNPTRDMANPPDLDWLEGYALISETRRIELPAGETQIRFEGVAGGILPVTAIVTGFPEGIVERNRDAYLLSPATLYDRSLGRRVHLRRTSNATGAVREQEAIVMSSAGGAVVLQTAQGFESLRCTGLPEAIDYEGVPPGLSAAPTLSVRARAGRPVSATVTLSYLATGFDWQANYIAELAADGSHVDLFAWLTLASMDETSFPNADTQAVAGDIDYHRAEPQPREGGPLQLQCWPAATTSDIPLEELNRAPPPAPPSVMGYADAESIVITGSRIRQPNLSSTTPITVITASQENLGDLKLYRIPEPVTVAAHSQKQVALMVRPDVRADLIYRDFVPAGQDVAPRGITLFLVTRNRSEEGLGLPLPAGPLLLYGEAEGRTIALGQGEVRDHAIGEDVEISVSVSAGVTARVELLRETDRWRDYRLTVSSDRAAPVRYEARFSGAGEGFRPEQRLGSDDGLPLWAVTVPANGSVSLRYRIVKGPDERRRAREERQRRERARSEAQD